MTIRKLRWAAGALLLALVHPLCAAATPDKIFPYPYTVDDLPNGFRLITVPTEFPHMVSMQVVMRVGSRNEVEAGRTGYAHFFEHMSFRGTEQYWSEQIDLMEKKLGADSNAYTSNDQTVFYETLDKSGLEQQMMIDVARCQHLKYSLEGFQTESRAVLGEFNKDFSDPVNKIDEVLRNTAFDQHTYKHTTMGFVQDVEAMPNGYDYSMSFYHRYYRPENATLLVVGDVSHDQVLQLATKYFGEWQPGAAAPPIPVEPEQTAPRQGHVHWETTTLPYVCVAYKSPAYADDTSDTAALNILGQWAFSQTSEFYQRLVVKEQKVADVSPMFDNYRDPYLVGVTVRVKDIKDVPYVQGIIQSTFEALKPPTAQQLSDLKSNLRYGFALGLDSSQAIADNLVPAIVLERTPETLNRLYATYDRLTPDDLQAVAQKYFIPAHRTILTLDNQP